MQNPCSKTSLRKNIKKESRGVVGEQKAGMHVCGTAGRQAWENEGMIEPLSHKEAKCQCVQMRARPHK